VSVEKTYEGWYRVQERLAARIPRLTTEELALKASPEGWPVWALIAHLAAGRVYWLCVVCGEPGLETTPFPDPATEGWEDHLDEPRTAPELAAAIDSSWVIAQSCLETWTPEMLDVSFTRTRNGLLEHHTRASVLTRIVMHDSFHGGEISLLLGARGLPSLDPWEPPPWPAA
jgi:uncharacterized damage-inducible protein DinB